MNQSHARTGLAESPVPGNRHAGFGKRPEESDGRKTATAPRADFTTQPTRGNPNC